MTDRDTRPPPQNLEGRYESFPSGKSPPEDPFISLHDLAALPENVARLEAERAEVEAFRNRPIVAHPLALWLFQRGIRPQEAARVFGTSRQELANIYAGRCYPRVGLRRRIADITGEDERALFPRP